MLDLTTIPAPLLVFGIVAGAVASIALLARLRLALLVVGAMFFVASISVSRTAWGAPIPQWLYPLQSNRSFIFMALGGLMALVVLGHYATTTLSRKSSQGIMLLAIGLYAGLLRVVHDGPGSGAESLFFATITIGTMVWVIPALIRNWGDIITLLQTLLLTNLVWVTCVAIQFGINPGNLYKGRQGRFYGLLGNAQHAAVFVGICAAIALWMFLNDTRRRWRLLWITLLAIDLGLLMWTGSRTGMGMVLIGLAAVAYGRFGRSVVLLPIAGIAALVAVQVLTVLGIDLLGTAERLTSTDDTRSGAWLTMLASGMSSPLIGVGIEDAGDSENSYLFGFAAYGLGMVALILVLVGVSLRVCWKLFRLRSRVEPLQRTLIDLVLAYNVMYFAGAMLEGYIMARVAGNVVLLCVFGSIASRIFALAEEDAWALEAADDDGDWSDDAEYEWSEGDGPDDTASEYDDHYDDGYVDDWSNAPQPA